MITKEICRDYALKIKEETGKFPTVNDWKIKDGYPCGMAKLYKLFDKSYNNFRDYCNEIHIVRKQKLSIEWLKSNCIIDENQCWNWAKYINSSGYGTVGENNNTYLTHRISYELTKGTIPADLVVRHLCNNRKCCNPSHLEVGTYSENNQDTWDSSKIKRNTNNILSNYTSTLASLEDKVDFYLENINVVNTCHISNLLSLNTKGYLHIKHIDKDYALHRIILANKLNKDYDELNVARHTCNNKACINPDHLIEGSQQENIRDSLFNKSSVKLTIDNILEIKQQLSFITTWKKGDKSAFDKKYADKFGVGIATIADIRRGTSWSHIN